VQSLIGDLSTSMGEYTSALNDLKNLSNYKVLSESDLDYYKQIGQEIADNELTEKQYADKKAEAEKRY
jgi:hypothetical protein